MDKNKNLFIVDKCVLPKVFAKVVDAKKILQNGKVKTVQEAISQVGLSRSAFYKYRDYVFPFYENITDRTITISLQLEDVAGLLSHVLNLIAEVGANILTINQNIPLNGVANVTITIDTGNMKQSIEQFIDMLKNLDNLQKVEIIAMQ